MMRSYSFTRSGLGTWARGGPLRASSLMFGTSPDRISERNTGKRVLYEANELI